MVKTSRRAVRGLISTANTTSVSWKSACYRESDMVVLGKTRGLFLIVLGFGFALRADDRPNHTLSATHTDRFNVPPSVSIRLENSFGEINVGGWDSPEVEVTVTKSVEQRNGEKANAAEQRLDSVQV